MLERLHVNGSLLCARWYAHSPQAMKRNKDDFCAITNEIASLIESVLQYARERDSVCERYKGVCDNFLR